MLDVDSHTFLTQIAYPVSEGGTQETSVQITVRCSFLTYQRSLTAYYSITPGTAHEGQGNDYIGTTGSVTLTGNMGGTATQTFSIRILRDIEVEGDETFGVSLTSVSEGELGRGFPGNPYTDAIVTITDNPPCVGVTLISDGSEVKAPATPQPIVVGVSCSGGNMSEPLTVSLHLRPLLESIAQADDDDLSFSQVIFAVPQGQNRETYHVIEIPVEDDNDPEWLETALIEAVPGTNCLAGECAWATITDNDAGMVYQDLPEETKPTPNEIDPGGVLSLNWDDDNGNAQADYLDGQQPSGAGSDDDLQPMTVDLPATYPGGVAQVGFSVGQNSKLRLWLDMAKTQPVSTNPYDWDDKPSTIYVEGIAPGDSAVTVTAHYGSYDYPGHILWEYPPVGDVVAITVLTAPTGFYTTLGNAKNVVDLHWTAPHVGETGFRLQWWKPAESTWEDLATLGEVETWSHTLPADYAGKTYDYRIFSIATIGGVFVTSGPATTSGSGIALQSVSFGGVGSQSIARDSGAGAYSGSQWMDGNMNGTINAAPGISEYSNGTIEAKVPYSDWKFPLSYVRSTTGNESRISASPILFYVGTAGANWKIQGSANDYHFLAQPAQAGGTWVWSSLDSCEALPVTIDNQTLTISWQLSIDGGDTWMDLSTSENHLYVTGGPEGEAFETVLDLGCKGAKGLIPQGNEDTNGNGILDGGEDANANGFLDDERAVADAIWGMFSGRSTKRVDRTEMKYDHSEGSAASAAGMLADATGRGRCTSWADLLVLTLVTQDVNLVSSVRIDPKDTYQFIGFKPSQAQGSGGNNYAESIFQFHQVVHITNRIYDPSYGGAPTVAATYVQAQKDYEDAHIDRYYGGRWDGSKWQAVQPGVLDTAQQVDAVWN